MQKTLFDEMESGTQNGHGDGESSPKQGFKKTKVGWIPEEWRLEKLSELLQADRDITYGIVKAGEFVEDGPIMIRSKSYTDGWMSNNELVKVTDKVEESYERSRVQAGDLVITVVGANLGVVGQVPDRLDGANISRAVARVAIDPDKAIPKFCKYYLQSQFGKRLAYKYRKGGAQDVLNLSDLKQYSIVFPPRPEQRRIAETISTWDHALTQINDLIVAKERRKKALMQQLLTGRTRFPEYEGEKRPRHIFRDVFRRVSSRGHQIKKSEYQDSGHYPVVDQGQERIVGYTDQAEKVVNEEPIIVFGDHTRTVKWVDFPFVVGADGTQLLKTTELCDLRYGLYLLQSVRLPDMGYSRHFKWLKEEHFHLPSLPEQKRIAGFLAHCDAEIQTLRAERDALQRQKKGMMQKLLTGTVRVPAARSSTQAAA